MKKPLKLIGCTKCGAGLSVQAESCSECGYPHVPANPIGDLEAAPAMLAEYRILRSVGVVVLMTGVLAALADARFAAGVAVTVGTSSFLAGVLGSWWNRNN